MKKLFVVLCTLLFTMPVFAIDSRDLGAAGFNNLSAADKAKIIIQVEEMANEGKLPTMDAPEKVEKWVNIGTSIGKGLAGAAKEVGVAANEFAKTPVGEMTMFLILWHFLSGPIIHVAGGLLVWLIGFGVIFTMIHKQKKVVEYASNDKGLVRTKEPLSGDAVAGYMISSAIVIIVGLIVMFTW